MTTLVFGGTGLIGTALWEADSRLPDLWSADSDACDITKRKQVRQLLLDVNPTHVVNAAWPQRKHLKGFANVMEETIALWQMQQRAGCLINIASIYATLPPRFEIYPEGTGKDPAYVAAKAAIVQLTRYYARRVRGSGIRVNAVSPGGVYRDEPADFVAAYSAQTNHRQMLPAKAVAEACRFLIGCEWVTGQNLVVDDGFTL